MVCKYCKKEFFVTPSKANKRKCCSRGCIAKLNSKLLLRENNPNWCGGITEMKSGYLLINIGANKREYLHRYIMQKHLGRKLMSTEIVHHLDGDKKNNDPINLKVMTQRQHVKYHLNKKEHNNG